MAIPTAYLPLDGDLEGQDRAGTFVATGSGALRWVDGPNTEHQGVRPLAVARPDFAEDELGAYDPVVHSLVTLGTGTNGPTWRIPKAKTPPASLLADFNGNVTAKTQHGDVALTTSGPVRYEPSRPLGIVGTNRCTNPRGVSDTSGWNTSSASLGRASGSGETWFVITGSSSSFSMWSTSTNRSTITGGQEFTVSADVRSPHNLPVRLRLVYRDSGGTSIGTYETTDVASSTWQRLVLTQQAPANAVDVIFYILVLTGASSGQVFHATRIQFEDEDSATPYLDGTMGAGYWTDTDGTHHREAWALQEGVTEYHGVPATTNLVLNPPAAEGLTHWATLNGTQSREAVSGAPSGVGYGVRCVSSGLMYSVISTAALVGATAGREFVLSIDCWADATVVGRTMQLIAEASGGATAASYTIGQHVLRSGWQRISVPMKVIQNDRTNINVVVDMTFRQAGDTYTLAGPQLEPGRIPTPLAHGDMPDHIWSGTPHASASHREPWAYGGSYVAEEGTTNLARNPLVDPSVNMTPDTGNFFGGWAGTNAVINPIDDTSSPTDRCIKVDADGSAVKQGVNFYANLGGYAPNTAYTLTPSVALRGSGGTYLVVTSVFYTDSSNASATEIEIEVDPNGWYRYVGPTLTTDSAKTVNYVVSSVRTKDYRAETFYATASQFESKPYATSFCPQLNDDGTLKARYAWSGTAHASSSTRSAGLLRVPIADYLQSSKGAIIIRANRLMNNMNTSAGQGIMSAGAYGEAGQDWIAFDFADTRLRLRTRAGTASPRTLYHDGPFNTGEWEDYYLDWDGVDVRFGTLDGTLVSGVRDAPVGDFAQHLDLSIAGFNNTDLYAINGPVDSAMTFGRPLTDAERDYISNADTWEWENVRHEDGSVQVGLEVTTNYVPNPSAEVSTNSWVAHSGVTLTRDNTEAMFGTYSFKHANNGTLANSGMYLNRNTVPALSGQAWTASVWVKGILGQSVVLTIEEANSGGGFLTYGSVESVLTGVWQRVVLTRFLTHPSTQRVSLGVAVKGTQASTLFIDGVQLENKPYATPYVDGDMADAEWTGTPHASSSMRTARADAGNTKSALIRYRENNSLATQLVKGSADIGTKGRARFKGGTLTLEPTAWNDTFEVESVAMWDVDVESIQPKIEAVSDWTRDNLFFGVDVPILVAFVEEGTTNLCTNPSFENDLTGWVSQGTPIRTRVEHEVFEGLSSMQVKAMGQSTYEGARCVFPVVSGRTYTASAWVKGPVGTRLRITLDGSGLGYRSAGGDGGVTLSGEWQHISVTGLCNLSGTGMTYIDTGNTVQEFIYYVDAVQIEEKPYATSFCPQFDPYGSLLEGYSWSGTPHASSSMRAAFTRSLDMPTGFSIERGSAVFRMFPYIADSGPLMSIEGYGTYDFLSWYWRDDGSISLTSLRPALSPQTLHSPAGQITFNAWNMVYYEWDGTSFGVAANGGPITTGVRDTPSGLEPSRIRYGHVNSADVGNAYHGGTILFDRPLTQSERDTLFTTDVWEWDTAFPQIGGMSRVIPTDSSYLPQAAGLEPISISRTFEGEL